MKNLTKTLCLLLCLLLPLAAIAAPTRDVRGSALSADELAAMRSWLDSTVRQALPVTYDKDMYVGAYVYECVEEGGCFVLSCDIYLEYNDDSLPEFAAEDALAWLCDATVCVKRVKDGYECVKCDIGAYYQVESFESFESADNGYEVTLPDFFAANGDGYDFSCYDEDGALVAGVTYRCEESSREDLAAYAAALGDEGDGEMRVDLELEIGMCTAHRAGVYVIVYADGGAYYSLTLTYPPERDAEFSLYAEFMRNSFLVADMSNG